MAAKPVPKPYQDTAHYWERARAHELVLQYCGDCDRFQFYPRGVCSGCLSSNLGWRTSPGRGTVYSFTVNHRAPHPGFVDEVPFVTAIIELEEGVRMMSNVVDCDPESVTIGMPVTVIFDDVNDSIALPKFKPA